MEKLPPPVMIDRADHMPDLLDGLRGIPRLGVDTESNSLYVYHERVCLVQISTPAQDYLLDVLSVPDLTGIQKLFEDPAIEKVFHAAEYDLICLRRDFGIRVRGLFDTHAAARCLGISEYGLNALLAAEFGVKLDKAMQRANWGRRPLSGRQIDYARYDTHFLLPLRDRLADRVSAAGYEAELHDEFERLEQIPDLESDQPVSDPFWRLRGVLELTPPQRAVCLALFEWREAEAERIDRPSFHVLSTEAMHRLAQEAPATLEGLAPSGVGEQAVHRWGKAILQAIERGKGRKPPVPRRNGRMDEAAQTRLEALRKWRKRRADARGVESDVILCRDAMFRIAKRAPRSAAELAEIPGVGACRLAAYGPEILATLNHPSPSGTANAD
jgi:ribonuclease D